MFEWLRSVQLELLLQNSNIGRSSCVQGCDHSASSASPALPSQSISSEVAAAAAAAAAAAHDSFA
jgi:hypothetical protein